MIVLDSSFPSAFTDAGHPAALALMEQFRDGVWSRGLLLEYVFLEVVSVLLVRRDLATATRVGSILLSRRTRVRALLGVASRNLALVLRSGHTTLSFADAAIANVAVQRTGGCILTFDQEFPKVPAFRPYLEVLLARSGPPAPLSWW